MTYICVQFWLSPVHRVIRNRLSDKDGTNWISHSGDGGPSSLFFWAAAVGYEADNAGVTRMRARVEFENKPIIKRSEPVFRYKWIIDVESLIHPRVDHWRRHSWIPRGCLNYRILNAVKIEYGRVFALRVLLALVTENLRLVFVN